jgi:hypothetical protein
MSLSRMCRRAVIVGAGVVSVCVPAPGAVAQGLPIPSLAPTGVGGSASGGSCTHDRHVNGIALIGGDLQNRTGGNEDAQCQGTGTQMIGPGVGQQSSVVGPTITSSVVNAPIQTSAGPAASTGTGTGGGL